MLGRCFFLRTANLQTARRFIAIKELAQNGHLVKCPARACRPSARTPRQVERGVLRNPSVDPFCVTRPFSFAQQKLLYFPGRGLGKLAEFNGCWAFKVCDLLSAESYDF